MGESLRWPRVAAGEIGKASTVRPEDIDTGPGTWVERVDRESASMFGVAADAGPASGAAWPDQPAQIAVDEAFPGTDPSEAWTTLPAQMPRDHQGTPAVAEVAGRLAVLLNAEPPHPQEPQAADAENLSPVGCGVFDDPVPIAVRRAARMEHSTGSEASWPALMMSVVLSLSVVLTVWMLAQTHRLPSLEGLWADAGGRPIAPAAATVAPVIWPADIVRSPGSPADGVQSSAGPSGDLQLRAGPAVASRQERDILRMAEHRLAAGDVIGARTVLLTAEPMGGPQIKLALAETFDPNVLAAWGISDAAPDPHQARHFYGLAQALGHGKAERRLRELDN